MGDGGGGVGAGGEGITCMTEKLEDFLNGGGKVLAQLNEEIIFYRVGRGIPCREGVPVAQTVRAPAHGSADIGGEHVRCAGERREEPLGHTFVCIKTSYLRNFFEGFLGGISKMILLYFLPFLPCLTGAVTTSCDSVLPCGN